MSGVSRHHESLTVFVRIALATIEVGVLAAAADGFEALWEIELDGPTHKRVRQAERDARKNAIIQAAGLRLLRIEADALPGIEALRRDLGIATVPQAAKPSAAVG